ncbi:hypothetical protein C1645_752281, partial [Glomus cerebriforme]
MYHINMLQKILLKIIIRNIHSLKKFLLKRIKENDKTLNITSFLILNLSIKSIV